ncbi:MAG: hypothetical protein PHV32_19330 [Eubacteriales bacterium]|nr:hypothetical protein [Eubacteriales bacterium]
MSVNHFSSEVASDVFSDPEEYKAIKDTLPQLEKSVKRTLSKSIKVPDIMEIPLECYEGIPAAALKQIIEWVLQEGKNAMWAATLMRFGEPQGDKILVNKARKEKAYYDKYHAQPDKFILVPHSLSDLIDMIIIAGGEEPPTEVVAMYNDYASRKAKWAYESVK